MGRYTTVTQSGNDTAHHFFLRHVPDHRESLATESGFRRVAEGVDLWEEDPMCFPGGMLKGLRHEDIAGWLMDKNIARQIYVCDVWRTGPPSGVLRITHG